MKMNYKPLHIASIFLMVILALSFQAGLSYAENEEIRAGVPENFPPHYSIDPKTGKPTGFAIDLMDKIAQNTGMKIRYVVYPNWGKTIEALTRGDVKLIPNVGIIEERQGEIDFTSPVETFDIVIFVREATTDIESIENLKGKEVAVVQYNKGLFLMQERGGSNLHIYNSMEEALLSLISGESDALVYPESPINQTLRKSGIEDRLKIAGKPLVEVKRGIAVKKGNDQLLKKLDDEVKAFIMTTQYKDIYAKWHRQPTPYWTPKRVAILGGILLVFIVILLLLWRRSSLLRMNRNLSMSLEDIKQAEQALAHYADELEKKNKELMDALAKVKTLSAMLPICSYCKKIRDDKGYWKQVEVYITEHTDTLFSHGMCPECAKKAYEELDKLKDEKP